MAMDDDEILFDASVNPQNNIYIEECKLNDFLNFKISQLLTSCT